MTLLEMTFVVRLLGSDGSSAVYSTVTHRTLEFVLMISRSRGHGADGAGGEGHFRIAASDLLVCKRSRHTVLSGR